MSEQATGEGTAILTPRLVFDSNADMDNDIPLFLRKKAGETLREPGDPNPQEPQEPVVEIQEPEAPVAVNEDLPEIPEPPEVTETIEAPSASEESVMTEAVEEVEDPSGIDGGSEQSTDLDELSVEELDRLQADIEAKKKAKREAEKKAVIDQIVNVVNTYQIPLEELVEALGGLKIKRKGVKAVQKFQDPATGATWSGRGKEPAWIKGKDRTPFLIT